MRSSFTKRLPLVAYYQYVYRTILMTASRPRWHFQLAVLVDTELGVFFDNMVPSRRSLQIELEGRDQ